ncbi:DVUA0089 family protein [Octadecabacter sp. 1_MG-2023]|uniref:DVUA0089 family protein n=1 Tax=unclassified Octadecabacter TaxID=196158 RepID=UPI001C084210|nr:MULTISPECIES: DVUA0089 family protein [unclassified Octadecabacter]MBU2993524.1 VPLPA-CTERM sorting domain-containing protein [Octadecabacter sp. B2R22]MDO6735633.1 DVUA0089 family protein [Octadecabacter sp. 1_MG-2023]
MKKFLSTIAATALMASAAHAATFSFSGEFVNDNDVVIFEFQVGALSDINLRSFSYGGGTQADGNVVAAGGFDPILTLFNSTGGLINSQDDSSNTTPDPITGNTYDVNLDVFALAAGTYSVAVSQYDNFNAGGNLSDGFFYDGAGNENFTAGIASCSNAIFCDVSDTNRTGAFAFDISGVDDAIIVVDPTPNVVPLPAGMPLMLAGIGAFAALRRRKNRV